jgi:flagellar hook-basal body complex protein FliE
MQTPASNVPLHSSGMQPMRLTERIIMCAREQIADLKMKMEDMSQEFGEMLKETLDKMSEKIEATSNEWEQDAGGGGNVEKKLEELGVAAQ